MSSSTKSEAVAVIDSEEIDDFATPSPPIEILALAPEEDGQIVYAPTASPSPELDPAAVIALKAQIRNKGDADLRLNRVTVSPIPPGGADEPLDIYDSQTIADGEVDSVFDADDPLGTVIPAGGTRWVAIQKRKANKTRNIIIEGSPPGGISLSFRFAGFGQEVTATRDLAPHVNQNGTLEGSYVYPFAARDLRRGEFCGGATGGIKSHHKNDERFAHDTGCKGFSPLTGEWSGRMPGTSGADNRDSRVFARPLYAMADGVVLGITNDRKDNDPNCKEGNEGNNKVVIRHGEERVAYLHLMRGSVEPELEVGDSVKAGQFLGLAGNSGNSTNPHFHMHAEGADGHLRPLLFREGWVADQEQLDTGDFTGPWLPLDDNALPVTPVGGGPSVVIWPSREVPRRVERQADSGSQGHAVDFFDAVTLGPTRVVTAEQGTDSGRLQLVSWDVEEDALTLLGDSGTLAGGVQALSLVGVSADQLVTAVRTQEGRLKVINWSISGDGSAFERLGDSGNQGGEPSEGLALPGASGQAPPIERVAAAHLGAGLVATAITSAAQALRVLIWDCSGLDVDLVGDSGAQPGTVDRLELAPAGAGRLVTATRNANERLELGLWDVTADGGTVTPVGESASTSVRIDSVALVATGPDQLVTAAKIQRCARVKLIAWSIDGDAIERGGDSGVRGDKIEVDGHALASLGQGMVATGIREKSSDTARLAVWCVESGGRSVTLLGDSGEQAGAVTQVAVTETGSESAVLVARTKSGARMKLIDWEIEK